MTYTVQRNDGSTTAVAGTVSGPSTGPVTLRDAVAAGGTFTYTVQAHDGTVGGPASAPSAPVTVAKDVAAPSVPSPVTATSPTPNTVVLTWAASTDADTPVDQLRYQVYRKATAGTGTGGSTPLAVTAPGALSFTDTVEGGTGLTADGGFTYYVAASDGPKASAKSAPAAVVVRSSILTDSFATLDAWALGSGASLDTTAGSPTAPSLSLVANPTTKQLGVASRSFPDGGYRTVCVQERVSVSAYDTAKGGQTTLIRVFSTSGLDIARVFIDNTGKLWIRSDWGSNPTITKVVVPADGSWHTVQLCTTTTPAGRHRLADRVLGRRQVRAAAQHRQLHRAARLGRDRRPGHPEVRSPGGRREHRHDPPLTSAGVAVGPYGPTATPRRQVTSIVACIHGWMAQM